MGKGTRERQVGGLYAADRSACSRHIQSVSGEILVGGCVGFAEYTFEYAEYTKYNLLYTVELGI